MYSFHINKYINENSDIHELNPFTKLFCMLITLIIVIITNNVIKLLIILIFLLFLILLTHIKFKIYLKNLKYIMPFIIFIVIINFFSKTNIDLTIISILKLIITYYYSILIIYTTKPNDITYGLEKILSPLKILKINTSSLALTISLSIRFIPIIFIQADKILKSQKSRGLNFKGNIKEKCEKIISIIFPIFDLSIKRSIDISNSLEIKLYNPLKKRTKYKQDFFTKSDENIILVHIALLAICLFMR